MSITDEIICDSQLLGARDWAPSKVNAYGCCLSYYWYYYVIIIFFIVVVIVTAITIEIVMKRICAYISQCLFYLCILIVQV